MSYTRSYHHIVFSTRFRIRCIARDRKQRLYAYITNIIKNKKCDLLAIDGMDDHIHILLDLHPTVALAEIVKVVKQASSKWINEGFILPLFEGWASEYYACSVSPAHVPMIGAYINNQETHHMGKEYAGEVKEFVEKMGMTLYQDLP